MGCTVAVGGAEEATATVLNTWDKEFIPIALESNIMHNKNISKHGGNWFCGISSLDLIGLMHQLLENSELNHKRRKDKKGFVIRLEG